MVGEIRSTAGTVAWASALGALVFVSGAVGAALRDTPDRVVGALLLLAVLAAASGVALHWRLRKAESRALRDPLTGLPNRALLEDRVGQALTRAQRTDEAFALIVIDLDNFKDVNDFRGHWAGDTVLRSLARRLESVVRASDTVARVGGDEFVVLSLATSTDELAGLLAGRLRQAVRSPFDVDGSTVEIDASVGWALYPGDGGTAEELLACADGQMYATKRDTSEEGLPFPRRGVDPGVLRDVESALAQNELVVLYQPILDLAGQPRGAEALVRRVLPNKRLLLPADFVPHVERTPLARELTFLVVSDALRSAETWARQGASLGVSVNVPYRLLDDEQFVDGLGTLLRSSTLSPAMLTLEVVPVGPGAGAELDDSAVIELAELGIRLSLDDGGRAASFAALRTLPLDELKIDRAFVQGIDRNRTDAALVQGLIDIGHALDVVVVAEGVETREAWNLLAEWGCDLAQGYYAATPRPADELVDWLNQSWPAVASRVA
jgi:diguanylate cyclase (GGDEF)-like protein